MPTTGVASEIRVAWRSLDGLLFVAANCGTQPIMPADLYGEYLKSLIATANAPRPHPYPSIYDYLVEVWSRRPATGPLLKASTEAKTGDSSDLAQLISKYLLTTKPRVFVSYHHRADRWYYDEFSRVFAGQYEICRDNSVDRVIDSDDSEYVMRRIRESYLTGSSCTIVLCGAQTRWRKFVDWEIRATLDKRHGLAGVNLPSNPRDLLGRVHKPDRLQDNIDSGFAVWMDWDSLITGGPDALRRSLKAAEVSSRGLIENWREPRKRNG